MVAEQLRPMPTLEQLRSCGYDAILDQGRIYNVMWEDLSRESKSDTADGAGALRFLAEICSMMLEPAKKERPFLPLCTMTDGTHSMIPEDLSADEVALMASFVTDVKNDMLRARLADLVWMKARKKGVTFAHMAIDAYCMHPIDVDSWHKGGQRLLASGATVVPLDQ